MYSKFFCTLRYIVRQRAYVIYDAIIYSKQPLLRLRPLPSNNELSAVKAHFCVQRFDLSEVKLHVKVVWRSAIMESGAPFVTTNSTIKTPMSHATCLATGRNI